MQCKVYTLQTGRCLYNQLFKIKLITFSRQHVNYETLTPIEFSTFDKLSLQVKTKHASCISYSSSRIPKYALKHICKNKIKIHYTYTLTFTAIILKVFYHFMMENISFNSTRYIFFVLFIKHIF